MEEYLEKNPGTEIQDEDMPPMSLWRPDKMRDLTYTQFWELVRERQIESVSLVCMTARQRQPSRCVRMLLPVPQSVLQAWSLLPRPSWRWAGTQFKKQDCRPGCCARGEALAGTQQTAMLQALPALTPSLHCCRPSTR